MKNTIMLLLAIIFSGTAFAQGIINNGATIYIAENAFVIGRDFTNLTSGQDGTIDLNGTLELEGNWENNSQVKNVFKNIETNPNGTVKFTNASTSLIGGETPTTFENVVILNGEKQITANESEITGTLTIGGVLNLNRNSLILLNTSSTAITYLNGCIISETSPDYGLGQIIWHTTGTSSTYRVPFGTGSSDNDLLIELNIEDTPTESKIITFATYPTDVYNEPFPVDIYSLGELEASKTADRYWKITSDYSSNPKFSIKLHYTNTDINQDNNPNLIENQLKIFRFNSDLTTWTDSIFTTTIDEMDNTALISNIKSDKLFSYMTLANYEETEIDIDIPNGITPNNDGYNDYWVIEDLAPNTNIHIYNRWGDLVYFTENYNNDWNGENNPSGAYYYILKFTNGNITSGTINILK